MTNKDGELSSPIENRIENYISHVADDEYGVEGHVKISGGKNDGKLTVESNDLVYGYMPGKCEKTFNITDFIINGLGDKSKLTGQLTISGERVVGGYKYTITDDDSFSYKGLTLTDDSEKEVIVQYGFDKQITSNGNTFSINYTNGETAQLTGSFSISGEVKNFTVESSNLVFNYLAPVRVWVEFNEYGELIDADLSELVDGTYMFRHTNVGQITNEDGTV